MPTTEYIETQYVIAEMQESAPDAVCGDVIQLLVSRNDSSRVNSVHAGVYNVLTLL